MSLQNQIKQFLTEEQFNNLTVPKINDEINIFDLADIIGIKAYIFNKSIWDDYQYNQLCFMTCIEQN